MGCPAAPAPETASFDAPIAEGVGSSIGPYRLMEQVGEGGMGLVFVAEQLQPVRRKVALKVIEARDGRLARQVVRSVRGGAASSTGSDGPSQHHAKVLDAGTTSERPAVTSSWNWSVAFRSPRYCDAISLPTPAAIGVVPAGV